MCGWQPPGTWLPLVSGGGTALTRSLGLQERAEGPEEWVPEERSGRGNSMCEVVEAGERLASAGEKEGRKESQRETGTGGQRDLFPPGGCLLMMVRLLL